MNSKHSIKQTNTNTLLRDTFVEFGSVTGRPVLLNATPNKYIIREHSKEDLSFDSEEKTIEYLNKEIKDAINFKM